MRNVTSSCTSYSTCFGPFFFLSFCFFCFLFLLFFFFFVFVVFFFFFFFLLFEYEEGQALLTQLGGPSPAWL